MAVKAANFLNAAGAPVRYRIGVNVGDLKTTRIIHFVDVLQLVHDRVGGSAVWERDGSIIDSLGYRVEHGYIVHEVKINTQCHLFEVVMYFRRNAYDRRCC